MHNPKHPNIRTVLLPTVDTKGMGHPTVYAFPKNRAPAIQTSGAPELMTKFWTSFEPEPAWLDNATWCGGEAQSSDAVRIFSASEVKDDLCLHLTQW